MDYEKKYKEALCWMRSVYPTMTGTVKEDAEHFFIELKDSDDEKIRKEIVSYIKSSGAVTNKQWIAWLEKQSEQKSIVEMKSPEESLGIDSDTYNKIVDECIYGDGEQKPDDITDKLKEEYQKGWDDAMQQLPKEVDSQIWQIANNAAKTWEESFSILYATQKAYDKGKKDALKEQKPAWSEEDEDIIEWLIGYLEYQIMNATIIEEKNNCSNAISMLKSLKERYTWKPSNEQIEALLKLEEMHVLEHERNQENAHLYMVVKSIREQLLKLRDE